MDNKDRSIGVRVSGEMYRRLSIGAQNRGIGIGTYVRMVLLEAMGGRLETGFEGDDGEIVVTKTWEAYDDSVPEKGIGKVGEYIPVERGGTLDDWLEESGILAAVSIVKSDEELEEGELNGFYRGQLKGEVAKLRAKESVDREDVFKLAKKYGIGKDKVEEN